MRLELCAQLDVVVDLAVEDERDTRGLVGYRLVGHLAKVKDAEPADTQPGVAKHHGASRVGAAMLDRLQDRVRVLRGRRCREADGAHDAAHALSLDDRVEQVADRATGELLANRERCGRGGRRRVDDVHCTR